MGVLSSIRRRYTDLLQPRRPAAADTLQWHGGSPGKIAAAMKRDALKNRVFNITKTLLLLQLLPLVEAAPWMFIGRHVWLQHLDGSQPNGFPLIELQCCRFTARLGRWPRLLGVHRQRQRQPCAVCGPQRCRWDGGCRAAAAAARHLLARCCRHRCGARQVSSYVLFLHLMTTHRARRSGCRPAPSGELS